MSILHTPITSNPKIPIRNDPLSDIPSESPVINYNEELPTNLNSKVNEFLKDLSKPKYSKPLNNDQIITIFQDFYEDFRKNATLLVKGSVNFNRVELKELKKLNDLSEDDLRVKKYAEVAEFRVCSALYERLLRFNEDNLKINKYINAKIGVINKIKGLDYGDLIDVHDVDLSLPILKQMSKKFKDFQVLKAPLQKLNVLVEIHSQLNGFLKEHLNSKISGDYFLPLFIYLILINTETVDFYLNFAYITGFRNSESLVGDALYCLTNLEAGLSFIQTLELEKYEFNELSKDEEIVRLQPDALVPNSNFFMNTVDTSFKLFSKFRPDDINDNPIKNFVGDVMKWTRTSTPVARESIRSRSTSLSSNLNVTSVANDDLPDIAKFKDRKFEELTVNDLRILFNDYQALTKHLRK